MSMRPYHLIALRRLAERSEVALEVETLIELQKLGLVSERLDSSVESPLTLAGKMILHDARKKLDGHGGPAD